MFVLKFGILIFCLSFARVNSAVIKKDLYQLDIVHFNDFHDRFEETSVEYAICKSNDDKCLGGFARFYYMIDKLFKEKQNPLVLNAGDVFKDTYWYTLKGWPIEQEFMNLLPVNATALGNHEFDDGPEVLGNYLKGLKSPVVAANVDASNELLLRGLFKPHIVLEMKGRRIGIIGLITELTGKKSNPGANVRFLDPVETARREALQLTNEGVDIIIVVSHCGLQDEIKIAEEAGENIDIIVGGHSHSLLWNGQTPSKEVAEGRYPELIKSNKNPDHKVVVVTASSFTKYLGNLTTYFDSNGELVSFDATPIFLNRSIPEDPQMKAKLKPYVDELHGIVYKVIGNTSEAMLPGLCEVGECYLGNLVTDCFRAKAMEINSSLPQLGFIQKNVMRNALPKGNITLDDAMGIMPFSNKIWTAEVQGKYVLEVLNMTWNAGAKSFGSVSGMKVTVNATDNTVKEVLVNEGGVYILLDENKFYQFTTINFFFNGGNGLMMLKKHARNIRHLALDYEVKEECIKRISPITPKLENRFVVLK